MAFTVSFGKATKAKNSTKIEVVGAGTQCVLKDYTTVVNPQFLIHLGKGGAPANFGALCEMNYCYVEEFKRYYFIVNCESNTAVLATIYCECDVLATFRDDILKTPAFIINAQSRRNSMIPDVRLPLLATSRTFSAERTIDMFSEVGTFAVTGVGTQSTGETGSAITVVVQSSEMKALTEKLYADSFWEGIKNDFYHPEEALLACMWTPINTNNASEGSGQIKIGKYDLISGNGAKRTASVSTTVPFVIPYTYPDENNEGGISDFRNFDPYTRYFIYLPGVGVVEFPMRIIAAHDITYNAAINVKVGISASPVTGDVTYKFYSPEQGTSPAIMLKGNFGVEVPISRSVGRFGSILTAGIGGSGSMIGGAMLGPQGLAIAGASAITSGITTAINSLQTNTTIVGALGGWSNTNNSTVKTLTVAYDLSDEPSALAPTIGCPYYHHVSALSACSGVVQAAGVHVKTWGTARELDRINEIVNSSGGFLVE